jgi:hypothetical protein
MDEKTIEELKRSGHKVAGDGISPQGDALLSVDGGMLTYPEVDALLEKDRKAKK